LARNVLDGSDMPHSRPLLALVCPPLAYLLLTAPVAASDGGMYANVLVGPAYFHNDDESERDSSGYGIAGQLDLGPKLTDWLVLHASVVADDSRAMAFDDSAQLDGEYVTTVLGLGLGATALWQGWAMGLASGAQLTWHPDPINPNDGSSGAGIGPFLALQGGYSVRVLDDVQLGARAFARYRFGKDEPDPSGYQLGLGLSLTLTSDNP
jgi:hypothetical protein